MHAYVRMYELIRAQSTPLQNAGVLCVYHAGQGLGHVLPNDASHYDSFTEADLDNGRLSQPESVSHLSHEQLQSLGCQELT